MENKEEFLEKVSRKTVPKNWWSWVSLTLSLVDVVLSITNVLDYRCICLDWEFTLQALCKQELVIE